MIQSLKYVQPQKKGMVTIPREYREILGIDESTILTVKIYKEGVFFKKIEKEDDQIEIYSKKRIQDFLEEDKIDAKTAKKLEKLLK